MFSKLKYTLALIVLSVMVAGCADPSTEVKKKTVGDSDSNYRGSWAQVPVILSRIKAPSFPNRTLIITDAPYNAIADGSTDARQAIQNAIIDVSRFGGGTVSIPRGEYYVDGPLNLENNVNLHLQEGSELLFSSNYESYLPQVLSRYEGTDVYNFSPLIYAYQKKNIAITGKGTLNGQAENSWSTWVDKASQEDLKRVPGSVKGEWEKVVRDMNNDNVPLFKRRFDRAGNLRTAFILFYDSENILLEGVNIIDSPFWVNHFYMSKNITVRNMTMNSLNKNNDGIDIESSQDVYIHNVDFATGDDCISIKSGRDLEGLQKMIPSKNIVVQNVRFLADDTIALGSEASGGVRNIFIENSEGTGLRKGFYFKANKNRGSHFEHIRMRNLTYGDLADVPENRRKLSMIEVTTNYDSTGVKYNRDPEFKDIRLENFIGGTSINPMILQGTDKIPLKDFVFDNVHLSAGENPNAFNFVDFDTMYFRNVTVDNSPLEALVDGGKNSILIPQLTNTPPDVYAGEEKILSLSHGNSISFSGDVLDAENDPMTFQWEAVPADAEAVSMGEDADGKNVNYPFGDASTVRFSNPTALATEITFEKPGTYRLRLNVNDGQATGYHTVFIEVRL
ncbi:glycosyl hydrolase family 28 protein [SAR92 clade bacterium H231]|nr:glycosyl hydrolase family 28 protein [SAR92 clade bacterium H231]